MTGLFLALAAQAQQGMIANSVSLPGQPTVVNGDGGLRIELNRP